MELPKDGAGSPPPRWLPSQNLKLNCRAAKSIGLEVSSPPSPECSRLDVTPNRVSSQCLSSWRFMKSSPRRG
ncbi:hypothetical protein M9458_019545, partial [Cirrhinus mrigala]